ncbi:hypothetical protein OSB04_016740 [Centaurea solstitialis]|uniref:Uncharacterized protein n=1 Tax=Centaurea solstitialis TaxID=347529 RepID=A0AA38WHR3_9ASTR|nr:hypothetical protein OSB04_016740 [Centaurea solstitialis]
MKDDLILSSTLYVIFEHQKKYGTLSYENFIHIKVETFSQTHLRFNYLLIDPKTIGTVYSNSKVITKFMESLLEH